MAGQLVEVTDQDFEETVLRSDVPVVVDLCWRVWPPNTTAG